LGVADLDITAACPRSERLMTTIFADPRRADMKDILMRFGVPEA